MELKKPWLEFEEQREVAKAAQTRMKEKETELIEYKATKQAPLEEKIKYCTTLLVGIDFSFNQILVIFI